MSRTRFFLAYWLPVLVWMSVIFSASSDSMSFHHTSRFIEPFLRWLAPNISNQTVHAVVFGVRKCAHMTEYGILALLLWRALSAGTPNQFRYWQSSRAGLVLLIVVLYACSDEWHQTFVPTREGSVWDVMLDTAGAACALLLLRFLLAHRGHVEV